MEDDINMNTNMEDGENGDIDTKRFLYQRLVDVAIRKKTIPTMVVNGEVMGTQAVETVVLLCPHCRCIVLQFPDGVGANEANMVMVDPKFHRQQLPRYCQACGQRLSFKREIVG